MSLTQRSSAFLQEMGVGPRWLLRDRVHAVVEEHVSVNQQAAVEEPVVVAEHAVPVPAVGRATAFEQAATVVTLPARPAPAVAEPAVPVPPPAALVPPPAAAPAPASAGEDTAWFDDAPAPPPKAPTLKQPAPPRTRAEAAPPTEDTSWFDAVPAAPVPRAPGRTAATDEEIAAMDWPELQAAVRSCTRCRLCETRRAAVPGAGDEKARWLVLGLAPTRADEKAEQPFAGPPGQLLQNMLRAVALSTERGAYVTTLVKCRPAADDGADRLPAADELAACRPYLQRELALTGAGLGLTLGGVTAKGLLGMAARGKVLRLDHAGGGLPVVATFHPADLLKKPEDKARAWADLCLARSADAARC
ncbi:uracil-DNA glycosylase [Pseudoduganella umbonata]|uniref:DNA polymerase n=1 Tax=Pseudoduganella umbonata TaxID=864828 RepID=A0A4P8I0U0_9BURK|nr:uracil-DNA glycosylase [Pseudoduganella umbonata]MBB3221796.1 DNA polymerase [Pseudoduganella umbonata]QCP14394.1 uracil-DNA glycosylase [Pseudoduganella umbonata]